MQSVDEVVTHQSMFQHSRRLLEVIALISAFAVPAWAVAFEHSEKRSPCSHYPAEYFCSPVIQARAWTSPIGIIPTNAQRPLE